MTVKLGFIGTGGIARNHLGNLAKIKDVSVNAFCDVQLERAELAARDWPNAKAYSNAAEMMDDSKLDAVYICLPPMAHGEAEHLAIDHNLPFFVEKPLAIDRKIPRGICQQVKAKNLITSVGFHWRYHDGTNKARSLLQDRQVGMALGYWLGGMPTVPWWRVQSGSGGQFVEQTIHIVDLLRYFCGEVTDVYAAYGQRIMHKKVEGVTVADVGTVTMKLASGVVATISNACMLPINHIGFDLYTDQGVLEIRNQSVKDVQKQLVTEYKNQSNAYLIEDEAFIHAVRTGDRSLILSDYEDALKTHEVAVAANESALSGKVVRLS